MKAKAFKNIGVLAMLFASFVSPSLNAQEVCDRCHRNNNSISETVDLVSTDPYELARLLRNTAGIGRDVMVAVSNQSVGLTGAAASAQILALNGQQTLINQAIASAVVNDRNFSGATVDAVTTLLNQFTVYQDNTFLTVQAGDTAGATANFAAWVNVGQQIVAAIDSVNRHVSATRLQNAINQYIVLEVQSQQAYLAGNYAGSILLTQQAVEVARLIGVHLARADMRDDHHHHAFNNLNYVDPNYVPNFNFSN